MMKIYVDELLEELLFIDFKFKDTKHISFTDIFYKKFLVSFSGKSNYITIDICFMRISKLKVVIVSKCNFYCVDFTKVK